MDEKPMSKNSLKDAPDIDVIHARPEPKPVHKRILKHLERGVYITAVLGLAIVLFYGLADRRMSNTTHQKKVQSLMKMNDSYNTKMLALAEEKKALEQKLATLKSSEDVAKRDLEAYITKKYRTVPRVVAKEVAGQVARLTREQDVPFSLIVGLIEVESQFKPWAISKKDARGLMQVMPFWIKKKKEIGMDLASKYDLHDIETNIKAGIQVFKFHLKEANNDINKGLYLYVGKDNTYANKVFNAMGRFEVFRSTLDTTLRDEENQEELKDTQAPKAKKEQ